MQRKKRMFHLVLIETLWNVKADTASFIAVATTVLIETLWNVKFNARGGYYNQFWRFNRNIVECKGRGIRLPISQEMVLIETLWNVKIFHAWVNAAISVVLIETLWNVKESVR